MADCTKHYYRNQASARHALARVLKKARKKPRPGAKLPRRVYPCDICDGWHLTAKKVYGKTPPWDLDPNWTRPDDGLRRPEPAPKR